MAINSALLNFLTQESGVQRLSVPEGAMVCQSGDVCESLVIVLEGKVKVYRPASSGRSITLYHVNKNESCILTASCILNKTVFPAFAVTMTEVEALSIPPNKVTSWLESEPMWQKYMFALLSQRMTNLIELVDSIAFEPLNIRLINWLLFRKDQQPILITHQQIAEDLATSREVISRMLKKFEDAGAIKLGRGLILIVNESALINF